GGDERGEHGTYVEPITKTSRRGRRGLLERRRPGPVPVGFPPAASPAPNSRRGAVDAGGAVRRRSGRAVHLGLADRLVGCSRVWARSGGGREPSSTTSRSPTTDDANATSGGNRQAVSSPGHGR